MKQFILDSLKDEVDTITISFTNGDKITFFQIYETYSDQENIIDLVELKTDYRHLVNIEQIAHIRLNV
ncbi:hypothetical protein [Streptococcus suis]|uniref:Uncharacterized protein n=1 Tax=Streptococcus suis TaxID=1307 RepID=A0A7T1P621_STRSU|nr:hypothetical protein [Streptococcus suis]MCQ8270954.1 hypothetical protein [Streptococcus suis]MDY7596182.1 hypothetical protein [Streptococcus suis]QPO26973.1 hypothetical protein I5V48_02210 [Streptococcus suis]HEL1581016.1 hypothetical protein [Streptococcus suis]HEL1641954.1 hypothetical protein [Streptococcus suis]